MEFSIQTRKSAKKNAINALMQWLIRDLKLENSKVFVQVILTSDVDNLGELHQIQPGCFVMAIRSKLTLTQTLQTVCHEMVHVKQFARGILANCQESGDLVWRGKRYSRDSDYYTQPWEVQAFSKEILLFRRATEFFSNLKG